MEEIIKKINNRPTLSDPQEFALIRSMYFEKDNFSREEIDPLERLDRMESRSRNINNNSR